MDKNLYNMIFKRKSFHYFKNVGNESIIKEAEKIEKSNKLLRLQVDLGEKTVQIVAGLAKDYDPEELIDRKVVVVANLKPAKLFGNKSEGMILATSDNCALLAPDEKAEVGEKIQ